MAPLPTTAPWPAFRAFAQSFIPETAGASEPEWRNLEAAVQSALDARPSAVRRQILLFVRLVDIAARARHRHGFGALDAARSTRLLQGLARSRILLLRRGVWGLRTLVMLGWYTDPAVIAALGYRAVAAGWDARK